MHCGQATSYGTLVQRLRISVQSYQFPCISQVFPSCYLYTRLNLPDLRLKSRTNHLHNFTHPNRNEQGFGWAYIRTHTWAPTGVWWMFMEAKGSVVCILSLGSHKKCFPSHATHGHQVACTRREDIKMCFCTTKDEDPRMEKFYALFLKHSTSM